MGGNLIDTYTGKTMNPVFPSVDDICIEDIAHALSQICRYNGHCKHFYSVAQHSLLVSDILAQRKSSAYVQLVGLLHDATEAYICDLVKPVKNQMENYSIVEERLQSVIWNAFEIRHPESLDWNYTVKFADEKAFEYECSYLMPTLAKTTPTMPNLKEIRFEDPKEVEQLFLSRFRTLRYAYAVTYAEGLSSWLYHSKI